jgi:hypothetical protein
VPDLDQVLAPPASSPGTRQIVEAELVVRGAERWARVDDSAALWGPLIGGEGLGNGATIVLAISQDGRPFVIYPQG